MGEGRRVSVFLLLLCQIESRDLGGRSPRGLSYTDRKEEGEAKEFGKAAAPLLRHPVVAVLVGSPSRWRFIHTDVCAGTPRSPDIRWRGNL